MIEGQREALAVVERSRIPSDEPSFEWVQFLRQILRERDLRDCVFRFSPTSLTIYPRRAPREIGWPFLCVTAGDHEIGLTLNVCQALTPGERWSHESVTCEPDDAEGEFDRLFATFASAVDCRPAAS